MTKRRLSIAISHYDRFAPLLEGVAEAKGFTLEVLQVSQTIDGRFGSERHERMLQHGEFDVAELSLSSYLMARARNLRFTAIPIFPRRLFSQSQIWVNGKRGIREPRDLIGGKVGLSSFQTTLSVLAKGDLQEEYGVPWRQIEWIVSKGENIPFELEQGVVMRNVPEGSTIGRMLEDGEIDAIFRPYLPDEMLADATNLQRLFPDPKAEEARYFRKTGFYPIMHVIAIRDDVLEKHPDAATSLYEMFVRMNETTEQYYDDPNWSRLVWGRLHIEEERRLLGRNVWPTGVAKNRANLDRFIGYSYDQGLISTMLPVDTLFAPAVLDT